MARNAPAATRRLVRVGAAEALRLHGTSRIGKAVERGNRGAVDCISIWDDNLSDCMSIRDDISRKFPFDEIAKSLASLSTKERGSLSRIAQVIDQFFL